MTQEDKELLLQDLCARLYCGVKITDGLHVTTLKVRIDTAPATLAQFISSENLKYYLRPLSSMTEEEVKEIQKINWQFCKDGFFVGAEDDGYCSVSQMADILKYLNEHHLDYRGLIEKGLVLEAPEGMY